MCFAFSVRVDGLAKVKGTVLYGDDITLPDMLYGVCHYAHIPAGKIDELDLSGALGVDGVVRIATWQEGGKTPTDYTGLSPQISYLTYVV